MPALGIFRVAFHVGHHQALLVNACAAHVHEVLHFRAEKFDERLSVRSLPAPHIVNNIKLFRPEFLLHVGDVLPITTDESCILFSLLKFGIAFAGQLAQCSLTTVEEGDMVPALMKLLPQKQSRETRPPNYQDVFGG